MSSPTACTGDLLRTLEGHSGRIYSMDFSPNGDALASGSGIYDYYGQGEADTTLRLWNVHTGDMTILEQPFSVTALDFSSDGQWIVFGGDGETSQTDEHIHFLNVASQEQPRMVGDYRFIHQLEFNRAGSLLAVVADTASAYQVVDLWTVSEDSGERMATLDLEQPTEFGTRQVTFSPDGTLLFLTSGSQLMVYSMPDGIQLATYTLSDATTRLAVSPNGAYLALGLRDGTVRIWGVRP